MEDVIKKQLCNFCINKEKNECLCYIEERYRNITIKKCNNYKLDKNIKLEKYIKL